MSRIFIVEENLADAAAEMRYLALSGIETDVFHDLGALTEELRRKQPDLIVMNPALPDGDVYQFLKRLRERYSLPVIITSENGAESDRVLGFELGCDDYLVKPFSMKELVLRIGAILRRSESRNSGFSCSVFQLTTPAGTEILTVNSSSHKIQLNEEMIDLTAAEWRVLSMLCQTPGNIYSRITIMEKCFEYSSESYDRIVDTHVKNIRSKLGDNGMAWIETVRGYGYRFSGVQINN